MNTARNSIRASALLALSLFLAMPTQAQAAAPGNGKQFRLLEDRLRLSLPATAVVNGGNYSIMEAPPAQETQARASVEVGRHKLVIIVHELFERSTAPILSVGTEDARSLEQEMKLATLSVKVGTRTAPGIDVAVLTPTAPAPVSDAWLQKDVVARRADGTLLRIGFFTGSREAGADQAVAAVIDTAIATLSPGDRALRSGSHARLDGTPVTLDLPPDYTAYPQRGPDFDVYWVVRLSRPGESPSRMGIYVGDHPQPGSAPPAARAVTSKVFGQQASWQEWEEANGVARCEAFVKSLGPGSRGGHVFILAASAAEREVLRGAIATGRFE